MILEKSEIKIIINGLSSPELELWEPLILKIITDNKSNLYHTGDIVSPEDKIYLDEKIYDYSVSKYIGKKDDKVLYLTLAYNLDCKFCNPDIQNACFFGGINSENLENQIIAARNLKIDTIYSDLLACEIEHFISAESMDFFYKSQHFIPHAFVEKIKILSKEKEKRILYLKDDKKIYSKTELVIEDSLIKSLNFNKNLDLLSVSQLGSGRIDELINLLNYRKLILGKMSIPIQHLVFDICEKRDIEIIKLFDDQLPSPHRRFLDGNRIFHSVFHTRRHDQSIRGLVNDVLIHTKRNGSGFQEKKYSGGLVFVKNENQIDDKNHFIGNESLYSNNTESFNIIEKKSSKLRVYGKFTLSLILDPTKIKLNTDNIHNKSIHELVFFHLGIKPEINNFYTIKEEILAGYLKYIFRNELIFNLRNLLILRFISNSEFGLLSKLILSIINIISPKNFKNIIYFTTSTLPNFGYKLFNQDLNYEKLILIKNDKHNASLLNLPYKSETEKSNEYKTENIYSDAIKFHIIHNKSIHIDNLRPFTEKVEKEFAKKPHYLPSIISNLVMGVLFKKLDLSSARTKSYYNIKDMLKSPFNLLKVIEFLSNKGFNDSATEIIAILRSSKTLNSVDRTLFEFHTIYIESLINQENNKIEAFINSKNNLFTVIKSRFFSTDTLILIMNIKHFIKDPKIEREVNLIESFFVSKF